MRDFLRNLSTRLLALIFPEACLGCKKESMLLCDACARALPAAERQGAAGAEATCPIRILSGFAYRDPVASRAIRMLKYRGGTSVAVALSSELYERTVEDISEWLALHHTKTPVIIPVPMSAQELQRRGRNHAAVAAARFADESVGTIRADILVKTRNTKRQARMKTREERLVNMKNCMATKNIASIAGASVILFDDVSTTGATIAEAARALRAGGFGGPLLAVTIAH